MISAFLTGIAIISDSIDDICRMEITMADERRYFIRIPFDSTAHINPSKGGLYLNCHVIDASLKGVLLTKPKAWTGKLGDSYTIDLFLENAHVVIKMDVTVAHIDDSHIGFVCQEIDSGSMTHPKQLLELNLSDSEIAS